MGIMALKSDMTKLKSDIAQETKIQIFEAIDLIKNELGNIREFQADIDRIDANIDNITSRIESLKNQNLLIAHKNPGIETDHAQVDDHIIAKIDA